MTERTSAASSSSRTDASSPKSRCSTNRPIWAHGVLSNDSGGSFGADLLGRLTTSVVGRRRELEAAVAALAAKRHLLLEGPPGTGKSTLLRSIAQGAGTGFVFVEGNAELTPSRLIGVFDPAAVISDGYTADAFVPGPLMRALQEGSLLYLEEVNRIPEETLNVLITVMSEHELHVPRLGRVAAADGFRLVAAMNPFDAIGTARIASAVYDRCCRLAMGYQSAEEETDIVLAAPAGTSTEASGGAAKPADVPSRAFVRAVVDLVRATRDHHDIRSGSSVRGAIDLVLLLGPLAGLREVQPDDESVTLDATLLALSGRIRVHESSSHTPEEILTKLWEQHLRGLTFNSEPSSAEDPSADPDMAPGQEFSESTGNQGKA